MKKKAIVISILMLFNLFALPVKAQEQEIMQLLLNVEKLNRLREIHSNMVKGYTVLSQGYQQVSRLSEGNFNIHKTFIDGLSQVSPLVRDYSRAKDIVSLQAELLKANRNAIANINTTTNLDFRERLQLEDLYGQHLKKGLELSQQTLSVLTAGVLKMSDGQRLETLDRLHRDILTELNRIAWLNEEIRQMTELRNRNQKDLETMFNLLQK